MSQGNLKFRVILNSPSENKIGVSNGGNFYLSFHWRNSKFTWRKMKLEFTPGEFEIPQNKRANL